MRNIIKESDYSWWISCVNPEDGGARITMDPSDGFLTVAYDAKWGRFGRHTIPDLERYSSWEAAYDTADKRLFSIENNLILVD